MAKAAARGRRDPPAPYQSVMLRRKGNESACRRSGRDAPAWRLLRRAGGEAEFTMYHKVTGNTFALSDDRGTVKGSGTLFGPAWKWTYFKATFEATNGARIDDEDFMADPNVLVARKRISGPDGKTIAFMDTTLKAITPGTFEILRAALLKKPK